MNMTYYPEVQVFEYFDKVIFTYTPASVKSTKNRPLMQIHANS